MKLTILGCHSATSRSDKFPTSQVLSFQNFSVLIDCGEVAQFQIRKAGLRLNQLRYVFISHLHGDHFYGLIGMLASLDSFKRGQALTIFGPKGIAQILELQINLTGLNLRYELDFVELESRESQLILEIPELRVVTIPLEHRIYTNGYLFVKKTKKRSIDKEKITNLTLEKYHYKQLLLGEDITLSDGSFYKNSSLTRLGPELKYAFCSDTSYLPSIVEIIRGVNVLYHEATFTQRHHATAVNTMHSTAKQAAMIARDAEVKTLILGHFSSRYKTKDEHLAEAKEVFENTLIAEDLKVIPIT